MNISVMNISVMNISVELADFLGKPHGLVMTCADVITQITSYISSNNLQDKYIRIIHPDTKLKKLLKLTDKDVLTYFNLRKYLFPHFEKCVETKINETLQKELNIKKINKLILNHLINKSVQTKYLSFNQWETKDETYERYINYYL